MQDQPVVGAVPVFFWRDAFEAGFDLVGRLAGREAGAIGDAENMRVNGDGRLAERFVEDDIRGLAANAWKSDQGRASVGNLTTELVDQHFRQGDDILRLVAPQTDRLDVVGDARLAEREHFLWRVSDLEQLLGCLVDADICGLRRQGNGDDQCERVDEVELGMRIGPISCEMGEKRLGARLVHGRAGALGLSRGGLGHEGAV